MEDSYVLQVPDRKFSDLYLCTCGYSKCEPLHSFGPAVRPHFLLHYILEGQGQYQVGSQSYKLEAGQGFLIEPEVRTFYQADSHAPWTYLWVGFDGMRVREYLGDIGLSGRRLTFRCPKKDELQALVFNVLKNNTISASNQFLQEGCLYAFFSILSQDMVLLPHPGQGASENLYVRKAMEYIQNNYYNGINVTDIANYVCINRSYLYTLFRENMRVSPQDYLTNYRITRASELLDLTDLPIEGVAQSCGYRDSLVFGRIFKAKQGLTPSQFRKQKRQQQLENQQKNRQLPDAGPLPAQ